MLMLDFHGDTVDGNPPASAGDAGSIPGQGRTHIPGSSYPMCHNYWGPTLKSGSAVTTDAPMLSRACTQQQEKSLLTATRESPHKAAKQRRPSTAKSKINIDFKKDFKKMLMLI